MAIVKIMVTQQDIDDAPQQGWKFGHPSYGPINNALCRILNLKKPDTQIKGRIYPNELYWNNGMAEGHVGLPDIVMKNLCMFDGGKNIKPFEFKIDFF